MHVCLKKSKIDSWSEAGFKPAMASEVDFEDTHFSYPERNHVQVTPTQWLDFSVKKHTMLTHYVVRGSEEECPADARFHSLGVADLIKPAHPLAESLAPLQLQA